MARWRCARRSASSRQRLLPALAAFSGLPHRVEFVDAINGVSYYDDSKGTNVGATLAALQGWGARWRSFSAARARSRTFRRSSRRWPSTAAPWR
jgi:UDP-N-acetylmuramoylalanine-D-glutamate ligase